MEFINTIITNVVIYKYDNIKMIFTIATSCFINIFTCIYNNNQWFVLYINTIMQKLISNRRWGKFLKFGFCHTVAGSLGWLLFDVSDYLCYHSARWYCWHWWFHYLLVRKQCRPVIPVPLHRGPYCKKEWNYNEYYSFEAYQQPTTNFINYLPSAMTLQWGHNGRVSPRWRWNTFAYDLHLAML